jgi:hypothetical protein
MREKHTPEEGILEQIFGQNETFKKKVYVWSRRAVKTPMKIGYKYETLIVEYSRSTQ